MLNPNLISSVSDTFLSIWIEQQFISLQAPVSQNGQTQSNNSSANADELFECVWPFCRIGAQKVIQKRGITFIGINIHW